MNGKWRFLLLFIFILILFKSIQYFDLFGKESVEIEFVPLDKVKVSVYYEALCPDSKFFVTAQMVPAFERLQNSIEIDFVPYGKAKTVEENGKWVFFCQHGPIECQANKYHACVIHLHQTQPVQLKYIACMITDNMLPDDAAEKCGKEQGLDFAPIQACANGPTGSELLKAYGDRTNSLKPIVKFIPTIELNNSQNKIPQPAILKNLFKSVCQVLDNKPDVCRN